MAPQAAVGDAPRAARLTGCARASGRWRKSLPQSPCSRSSSMTSGSQCLYYPAVALAAFPFLALLSLDRQRVIGRLDLDVLFADQRRQFLLHRIVAVVLEDSGIVVVGRIGLGSDSVSASFVSNWRAFMMKKQTVSSGIVSSTVCSVPVPAPCYIVCRPFRPVRLRGRARHAGLSSGLAFASPR